MLAVGRFMVKKIIPIADEATEQLGNAYEKYGNLENAAIHLFEMKEMVYEKAAKYYVNTLHELNLRDYDYDVEDFMYDYYSLFKTAYIDDLLETIEKYYTKFTHKKINAEYKRNFRKATRTRAYGSSLETSILAGTFNFLSSTAHSVFNAVDGAITNAGIDSDMNKVYEECEHEVWECTDSDIYNMGILFIIIADFDSFYIRNEQKALKIKKAINNGDVPQNKLKEKIAEILFLMPQHDDTYIWAFNLVGDSNDELERYAELFGKKETASEVRRLKIKIKLQREKARKQRELEEEQARAEKRRQDELKRESVSIFGNESERMDRIYSDNLFYSLFLDTPSASFDKTARKMCQVLKNSSNITSKYIWSRDTSRFDHKLNEEIKQMFENFKCTPPNNADVAMMISCDGYYNTLLLTDKKIFSVTVSETPISYFYNEMKSFVYTDTDGMLMHNGCIKINGEIFADVEFDKQVFNVIRNIINIFKLKNNYILSTITFENFVRRLQDTYSNISSIYYKNPSNSKAQKKFNSALSSYVKLTNNEVPFLLFDSTLFGGAKDGFVLTNKGIHLHSIAQDTVYIPYERFYSVSQSKKSSRVTINEIETDTGALNDEDKTKLIALFNDCQLYFVNPLDRSTN